MYLALTHSFCPQIPSLLLPELTSLQLAEINALKQDIVVLESLERQEEEIATQVLNEVEKIKADAGGTLHTVEVVGSVVWLHKYQSAMQRIQQEKEKNQELQNVKKEQTAEEVEGMNTDRTQQFPQNAFDSMDTT